MHVDLVPAAIVPERNLAGSALALPGDLRVVVLQLLEQDLASPAAWNSFTYSSCASFRSPVQ